MHLVYDLLQGDKGNVKSDIVYNKHKNTKLMMNTYYPINFDGKLLYPCVIFINGGCGPSVRLPKNYIKHLDSWCGLLANHYFIAAYFYWRYEFSTDIQDAINFICKNSKRLNVDANRLGAFTFSRGVSIGIKQLLQLDRKTFNPDYS